MKAAPFAVVAFALTLSGCAAVQQGAQQRYAELAAGALPVLLCEAPDLEQCKPLNGVSIAGDTVKIDEHELRAAIPDNALRSLQVSCARPTNVTVFEDCNFRGRVATYQCLPTEQKKVQTLEVRHFGPLAGKISGIAFSERGGAGVAAVDHAAVPLWQASIGGKTPADLVAEGVAMQLAGASGTMTAADRLALADAATLIPQCRVPAASGASAAGALASSTPISTQIYWTDEVNIPPETPVPRPDGAAPMLSRGCLDPTDLAYRRRDLLVIRHSARLRVNYPLPEVSVDQPEYAIEMIWYFDPAIRAEAGPNRTNAVALEVVKSAWTVDGQSVWDIVDNNTPVGWFADLVGLEIGPADAIANAVRDSVAGAGDQVACSILRAVKDGGDAIVSGGGTAVLSDRSRITFGYDTADPNVPGSVPCNARASSRYACGHYRSTPPTIVLHRN